MEMISFPLVVTVICGIAIVIITFIISQKEKTPKWARLSTLVFSIAIILCGLFEALEQSKTDKDILHSITGGDSYCYIEFGITPKRNTIEVYLISKGKYPLYDISIRIYDITRQNELKYLTPENLKKIQTYYDFKNLYPGTATRLGSMDKKNFDNQDFNVFFMARNGQWIQETRIREIDKKWFNATRVQRGKNNLYEHIQKGFPLNKNNEVDW